MSERTSKWRATARYATPVLVVVALLAWAIVERTRTLEHARELYVFGSMAEIRLAGVEAQRATAALDAIERRLNALHLEWHPWERSSLTTLNAALARGEPHETTPDVLALIEAAREPHRRSGGRFDPAIGALVELRGFQTSTYPVERDGPGRDALDAWLRERGHFDELVVEGRVVSSPRPLELDFNAMAEGAAVREAKALLDAHRVPRALLSLGGDIHAHGERQPWRIAVRDPEDGVLGAVALDGGESLFSSGSYARFAIGTTGEHQSHILDPRTGESVDAVVATVVLTRDPVRADTTATALMVTDGEWAEVARAMGVACALVVDRDGVVHATRALADRIAWQTARRVEIVGEPARCE